MLPYFNWYTTAGSIKSLEVCAEQLAWQWLLLCLFADGLSHQAMCISQAIRESYSPYLAVSIHDHTARRLHQRAQLRCGGAYARAVYFWLTLKSPVNARIVTKSNVPVIASSSECRRNVTHSPASCQQTPDNRFILNVTRLFARCWYILICLPTVDDR